MKLDEYLKSNNTTRYEVSKISGISESSFKNLLLQDVSNYAGRFYRAIGLVLGKTGGQVYDEITADDNTVFNFLGKHHVHDKERVTELLDYMLYFKKHDIDVTNVSFNRFENEIENGNISGDEDDVLQVIDNLIETFKTMKENVEAGNLPLPEKMD
ncbi:hypothetical protein [Leuconostoc gelidum]|uniref:hypothetical protein n=1 Tax=Leuconostoc gelidum TaxID=1244 RepID=UPI000219213C|nr:hypothetical protein [Leuconostoc gelidum]GMA66758.1 hypothetical protein GCM10025884_03850 [Leuconostoc gelidum subsp. gelidum]